MNINKGRFDLLTKILRTPEASRRAAERVILEGCGVSEAAAMEQVLQPSVSRTVKKIRTLHGEIRSEYAREGRPQRASKRT